MHYICFTLPNLRIVKDYIVCLDLKSVAKLPFCADYLIGLIKSLISVYISSLGKGTHVTPAQHFTSKLNQSRVA